MANGISKPRKSVPQRKPHTSPTSRIPIPQRRPKHIDKTKVVDTAINNPKLTHGEVAAIYDIDRSRVSRILTEFNVNKEHTEEFISNEALIISNLRRKIINNITDDEIKKAPVQIKMMSYGILVDKYRLLSGQSTENVAHIHTTLSDRANKLKALIDTIHDK